MSSSLLYGRIFVSSIKDFKGRIFSNYFGEGYHLWGEFHVEDGYLESHELLKQKKIWRTCDDDRSTVCGFAGLGSQSEYASLVVSLHRRILGYFYVHFEDFAPYLGTLSRCRILGDIFRFPRGSSGSTSRHGFLGPTGRHSLGFLEVFTISFEVRVPRISVCLSELIQFYL